MIRIRASIPKPSKQTPTPSKPHPNSENVKPLSFNTRGYFNPTDCCDSDYLSEKQRVF